MVIISGAGEKAFCAGGDIRGKSDHLLPVATKDVLNTEARECCYVDITDKWKEGDTVAEDFFREEYILNNMIGQSVIA